MTVSHFVKIDAAVDHVAVVRQIGEVIYSNQSTAVAAVCGVITEGFGSSLTADVIGSVAEDGTGLNVVEALKIHRGIDGNGERSLGVVHPVGIGGNGEDMLNNKTEAAYTLLCQDKGINVPAYIKEAIEWIRR